MKHLKDYWYFYIVSIFLLIIILPGNGPTIQKIFQDSSAHANLIGAVIGGFLAGLVAIYTVNRQHNLALQREEEKTITEKNTFIKSITTEITVLRKWYMNVLGDSVNSYVPGENPNDRGVFGNGLSFINHSYFSYYENNVNKINLIDSQLASNIILTYIGMKALLDGWVEYYKNVQFYSTETESCTMRIEDAVQFQVYLKNKLTKEFDNLKKEQDKMNNIVDDTLAQLTKR